MNSDALRHFGQALMREVRDQALTDWKMIRAHEMRGVRAEICRALIEAGDLDGLTSEIVDGVLHHMLRLIETNSDINVLVKGVEIVAQSDGLAGELPTEHGWIGQWSNFPLSRSRS